MNIKRQYILPNCNLILEGLEDSDIENVDILDGQSPMSILINAECNFLNSNQTLSGGSVFLENLSRAVSLYAQEFLSGLSQPKTGSLEYPQVTVEKIDSYLHRVAVDPEPNGDEAKTEVKLTTVELFDLVDAIDRFYGDRNAARLERMILALAMAAAAFFVIPPPEVRPPQSEPIEPTTETESTTPQGTPPTPEAEPTPEPNSNTETAPE